MKRSQALSFAALVVGLIAGGIAFGIFPDLPGWLGILIVLGVWGWLTQIMVETEAVRTLVDRDF